MTQHEYEFLTNNWEGPKGAAYNQVFEFCRSFGWCAGFDYSGRPILTRKGVKALKSYSSSTNNERIDVC